MSQTHLEALNLNLLVALRALLQTESVTRAARQLGVTQSAASRSLGQLRLLLDDPVLVRTGSRMVPTPRALALRGPLQDALDRLGAVLQIGTPFDPETSSRRFRLATSDVASPLLLPTLTEDWPAGVTLAVQRLHPETLLADLETGTLDLALGPAMERSGLVCEPLIELPFAVALRDTHPGRDRLDLDAYTRWPHVLVSPLHDDDDDARSVAGVALAALGRTRHVAVRVPSFLSAPWALLGTDHLLTAPRAFLERVTGDLPLVVREPPLSLPPLRLHAVWHARWQADPAHRWLRARLAALSRHGQSR